MTAETPVQVALVYKVSPHELSQVTTRSGLHRGQRSSLALYS